MMPLQTIDDYHRFLSGRDKSHHVLMEVRCTVDQAIICDAVGGLHLDGPLAYGAYLDLSRDERESLPSINSPWCLDFPIPLSIWTAEYGGDPDPRLCTSDGRVWGWCASDNLSPWANRHRVDVRGPTAVRDMIRKGNRRRVNVAAGEFKPVNHAYPALWPEGGELRWLAHGDPGEVLRLLKNVDALGKRHNTGNGKISLDEDLTPNWTVTPIDGDWSHHNEDGKLIRRIPTDTQPARLGTIRAPYHHRSRQIFTTGPG